MKKSSKQNIAIVALSLVVVVLLLAMVYQNFFMNLNDRPPLETPTKDVVVSLEDYTVFDLEDISFKFVIAKIKISSNEAINIPLSNFNTNENVTLSSVDQYRKSLEMNDYNLSMLSVTNSDLVSLDNSMEANLFIPVRSINIDQIELRISDSYQQTLNVNIEPLVIDLENVTGTAQMLGKDENEDPDEQIPTNPDDFEPVDPFTFGSLNQIDENAIFIESEEGELISVGYPSVVSVYTLDVTVSSHERTGISAARITIDDTGEQFYAIGAEYVYLFGNNVVDDFDFFYDGYLIFEVSSDNPFILADDVSITIEYQIIDHDEWYTVGNS